VVGAPGALDAAGVDVLDIDCPRGRSDEGKHMHKLERTRDTDLSRIAQADLARLCYTCGICVGDCPAARFSEDFNPRQIFLKVCLGIEDGLVGEKSPIWKCTTCYTCYERCPAGVKPLDVILALRNLSYSRGACPGGLRNVRASVLEGGMVAAPTQRVRELRQKLDLPALPDEDLSNEVKGILGEN
jgi:heterodisulfide reductase subunit C